MHKNKIVKNRELEELKTKLRTYFADYVSSHGCGCCADAEESNKAYDRITKLLDVPEEEGFRDIFVYRSK